MPVRYPTAAEVETAFVNALRAGFPAAAPLDTSRFDTLFRGVQNQTSWLPVGNGVQIFEANGARLFQISWEFIIDKMNVGLAAELRYRAAQLQTGLQSLGVDNPLSVSLQHVGCEQKQDGPKTVVTCKAKGILG